MAQRRLVLPLVLALLAAGPARADEPTATARAAATVLFQEGRAAAQSGDWPRACGKLQASFELDPAVGTLINLADCREHLGQLADAWNRYTRASGRLEPADPRLALVKARLAALAPRLPKLTIALAPGAPGGTAVRLDTAELPGGALGAELPLDPGTHMVHVTAPERAERSYPVEIREGEHQRLDVEPGPPRVGAPSPPPAPPAGVTPTVDPPGSAGRLGPLRIAGIAVGSAGVAGLVTAIATGLILPAKKSALAGHCDPTTRVCDATGLSIAQEGQALVITNTVAWIAGGIAAAAGVVMVIAGGNRRAPATALTLRVAPAGAALGGRF